MVRIPNGKYAPRNAQRLYEGPRFLSLYSRARTPALNQAPTKALSSGLDRSTKGERTKESPSNRKYKAPLALLIEYMSRKMSVLCQRTKLRSSFIHEMNVRDPR